MGAGADCFAAGTDCNQIGYCKGKVVGCKVGQSLNCTNASCANLCTSPTNPKYCPATPSLPHICVGPAKDCKTLVQCADGKFYSCAPGGVLNCLTKTCD